MTAKLTIDKSGRVTIPKRVRVNLGLSPGDSLIMESAGKEIALRPLRDETFLTRERGVWVCQTGSPIPVQTTNSLLRAIRKRGKILS